MSDRTHLKLVGLLWALIAIAALAGSDDDTAGFVVWSLAAFAYIASFFADRRAA